MRNYSQKKLDIGLAKSKKASQKLLFILVLVGLALSVALIGLNNYQYDDGNGLTGYAIAPALAPAPAAPAALAPAAPAPAAPIGDDPDIPFEVNTFAPDDPNVNYADIPFEVNANAGWFDMLKADAGAFFDTENYRFPRTDAERGERILVASAWFSAANTVNSLADAFGWQDSDEYMWNSVADLADDISPDAQAKKECTWPFDGNTPVNVLPGIEGDLGIVLEGRVTPYDDAVPCTNSTGDLDVRICDLAFPGTSYECVEGVCIDPASDWGLPVTYESNLYNIEFIVDGSSLFDEDDDDSDKIKFKVELMPGNLKIMNITNVTNLGSVNMINQNALLFFNNVNYTDVCLVFTSTTGTLSDLLNEYSGNPSTMCTTLTAGRALNPGNTHVSQVFGDALVSSLSLGIIG